MKSAVADFIKRPFRASTTLGFSDLSRKRNMGWTFLGLSIIRHLPMPIVWNVGTMVCWE
jgi:hypothetical protein